MHFVKVEVRRNPTTHITVHVGAWEVPVMEQKHGAERLSVGETVDFPKRDWPTDAASEMQRLNRLYGRTGSGDNAATFAEQVYGPGSAGLKALAAAIKEARSAAEKPKRRGKATEDLVGSKTA